MGAEKEVTVLERFQSIIARKYGLGEKLVTGHAKKYFDEASIEHTKFHIKKALQEAAEKAECYQGCDDKLYVASLSILESYPESNIK